MILDSINCPKCGAPLALQTNQKLVVCGYCNSSVRVALEAKDQQPIAKQAEEIAPEVIDEVKSLLVLGLKIQATDYYFEKAHVSREEAEIAVTALNADIGYVSPLNAQGYVMLVGLWLLSVVGVVASLWLWQAGWTVAAVILLILSVVFAYMNWFALRKGLKASLVAWRGSPAQATILKSWRIREIKILGEERPAELLRLLLEVRPPYGAAYQTESNCFVSPQSLPKFQVGKMLDVKCDTGDRKKVVVTGMAKG